MAIEFEKESLSMLTICESCGNKFSVDNRSVTFKREFNVNGVSIFLTYYDCPECGRRHFVQIDDRRSLSMLKNNEKQFVRLAVARSKGKHIQQKQSDKFRKNKEHLANYRMELMKQYTGSFLHDEETDTEFELRFSV